MSKALRNVGTVKHSSREHLDEIFVTGIAAEASDQEIGGVPSHKLEIIEFYSSLAQALSLTNIGYLVQRVRANRYIAPRARYQGVSTSGQSGADTGHTIKLPMQTSRLK